MAALDLLGRRWALRVLWELRSGPLTFRALQEACDGVSPTVLNARLAELREAGILLDRRQGRWVYYRINPAAVAELTRLGELLCCEDGVECCSPSPRETQRR